MARAKRLLLCAALAACCIAGRAGWLRAHDSPEHVLDLINAEMVEEGRTATRYLQRAMVYRQLNRHSEAADDLEEALRLEPTLPGVRVQLSRVYLDQDKPAAALATVEAAMAEEKREWARAPLHAVRAEVKLAMGQVDAALADCEKALTYSPLDVNLYLKRVDLQRRMRVPAETRAQGLREGHQRTASAVLLTEWVEAMIEAGRFNEILETIEAQLADSRWKSSWLLRRARCRVGLGREGDANNDLAEAVRELDSRITPDLPDPSLLADRGLAKALLGDLAGARTDYAKANECGAEPWMLRRLEAALEIFPCPANRPSDRLSPP